MLTARDGLRWHLIERTPFEYDFSSALSQIRAARETNLQVIWDLFHYGYPDDLDLMSAEFVGRFAAFAGKFAELLISEKIEKPILCLANEISFFAWIAGEVGGWFPFLRGRGDDLKRQLVKASIAAAAAIKKAAPNAILLQTDPIVRVTPSPGKSENIIHAKNLNNAQFYALDLLLGKSEPELGGSPQIIDAIGVNYYSRNQWRHPSGRTVKPGNRNYQPFSELLQDYYARYQMPLFIAETGIENAARAEWFRYICDESEKAISKGVPILGICLYPIVNHPGWDDNRHCRNGLWDYPNDFGERAIYEPLAEEIKRRANFGVSSAAAAASRRF